MTINVSLVKTSDEEEESASEAAPDAVQPDSAPAKRARPLSDQVRRFVREYVRDRDGTAAAARAGYSRNNATHWAEATLARPEVQAAISAELARREAAQRDIKERVLDEVMRIAFSDPGRIARWTPEGMKLIHSVDLTDDDRAAVKRITLGPSPGKGKKRAQLFEMHDKLAALELLSRLTGMLPRGKAPTQINRYDQRNPREILRERLMKIVRAGASTSASTSSAAVQDGASPPPPPSASAGVGSARDEASKTPSAGPTAQNEGEKSGEKKEG